MIKSYIWTFVNRFLHILLIITFTLSYIFADSHKLFYYHALLGVLFGMIILFRTIWGFVGTKYSLFRDFIFKGVFSYLFSILKDKQKFVGHNPASSIAIILMLIFGILVVISGLLALGVEKNAGIFADLYFKYSIFKEIKDLHEVFVNIFLTIAIIHIIGVLIDKFYNKSDALNSMISGYKKTNSNENVSLNLFQKIFFVLFLVSFIFGIYYLFEPKNKIIGINEYDLKMDFTHNKEYKLYKKECGSCHIAYIPYLLPKQAWTNIMNNLENHFGDDASLDENDTNTILTFLNKNSMDNFDIKFRSELGKENINEIAITKYNFYKEAHKKIPNEIFKSKEVKSRANCQNCHEFALEGVFYKTK